jgi:XapX domain-containing protein
MNTVAVLAALAVGFSAGALFTSLQLPIPAPPELPGAMAILGIYIGYVVVERLDVGFDLLGALGF